MDSYEEYKVENRPQHTSWINIPNIQPLDIILTATLPTLRYESKLFDTADMKFSKYNFVHFINLFQLQ